MASNTFMIGATNGTLSTLPVTPGLTIFNAIKSNGLDRVYKDYEVIFTRPGQAPGVVVKDLGVTIQAGDIIVISEEVKGAGFGLVTFNLTGDETRTVVIDATKMTTLAQALRQAKLPDLGLFTDARTGKLISAGGLVEPGMVIKVEGLTSAPAESVITVTTIRDREYTIEIDEDDLIETVLDDLDIELDEGEEVVDLATGETIDLFDPAKAGMRLSIRKAAVEHAAELDAAPAPVPALAPPAVPGDTPVERNLFDILVPGTDPSALQSEAEDFSRQAREAEAEAARLEAEARELKARAAAYVTRSVQIEAALAAFAKAKAALADLGVPVPTDPAPEPVEDPRVGFFRGLLESLQYGSLKAFAKTAGLKTSGKKADLVSRLMGESE